MAISRILESGGQALLGNAAQLQMERRHIHSNTNNDNNNKKNNSSNDTKHRTRIIRIRMINNTNSI